MEYLQFLDINEIEIDEEIYPRNQTDWQLTYSYQKAMQVGSEFPPIVVGEVNDKYIIIDGVHRFHAWKNLKTEKIPVILSTSLRKDWYKESVALNVKNGKRLSMQEKITAAVRLKEMGYPPEEIVITIGIGPIEIARFTNDRLIVSSSGKDALVAKASLFNSKHKIRSKEDQHIFHSTDQKSILLQTLELIEKNLINWEDAYIVSLLQKLESALGKLFLIRNE